MAGTATIEQTIANSSIEPLDPVSQTTEELPMGGLVSGSTRAVAIPETEQDEYTRQRAAEFIGACLSSHELDYRGSESHLDVEPIESLFDAIHKAAEGDMNARAVVRTNVMTEGIEITQKVKHVNEVSQDIDEAKRIRQHGQSQHSIQANSLRYATKNRKMRPRVDAEVRNSFRFADAHEQGVFEDSVIVVFSPADNMSKQEAGDAGFFTDTMTCMIQLTDSEGNRIDTEIAMVAGVKQPDDERHDFAALEYVGELFGVDLTNKTAAEMIDTPIIIPKWMVPNGVSDVAAAYDKGVELKTGEEVFFGQSIAAGETKDYQAVVDRSKEIQRQFVPSIETATDEIIANAASIFDEVHSTKVLHKITEKHMVKQAVTDTTINPRVFGPAASSIVAARMHFEAGNYEQAAMQTSQAVKRAVSSSCPSGAKKGKVGFGFEDSSSESDDEDQFGSLTFACTAGHINTRERGKLRTTCRVKNCSGTVGC